MLVKHPIVVPWFTRLWGIGLSSDGYPNKCTKIIADPTFDTNWNVDSIPAAVVQTTTYAADPTGLNRWRANGAEPYLQWTSGYLDSIAIDVNNVANLSGMAIHAYGENCEISNVQIYRAGKSGLLITGTGGGSNLFRNISIWLCGDGAVKLTSHKVYNVPESGNFLKFIGMSGDVNSPAYFYFDGAGGQTVEILGLKFEHPSLVSDSIFLFDTDLTLNTVPARTLVHVSGMWSQGFIISGPDNGQYADYAAIINKPGGDATYWPKVKLTIQNSLVQFLNRLNDKTFNAGVGRVVPFLDQIAFFSYCNYVEESFGLYTPSQVVTY